VARDETVRVFPLSNWAEFDIWEYIRAESIPVVPLYFAKMRPVVRREGALIVVDDERMEYRPGEQAREELVRFRTLGDWPLSGAIASEATTVEQVIGEMISARTSERQGRLIDNDEAASMEKKKREGYF
jgi:sulfate adenylyltransferase subunit 2